MTRKLRIANSHYHVAHLLAPWIAYEWGFFEEEGVGEVDIIGGGLVAAFVERVALATVMQEKGIDIVVDAKPPAIFYANSKGQDLYIIGCWRSHLPFKFFTTPDITSIEQLAGKRIARRDNGCISSTALSVQLEAAGMNAAEDVQWLSGYPTVPNHAALALLEGKVDCAPVPAQFAPKVQERGFRQLLDMQKVYPEGRPDRIVAATGAILREDPERVTALLRSLVRGYWMVRNPKNNRYLSALDQRLRKNSYAPQEHYVWADPEVLEALPHPIDGRPVSLLGLERLANEAKKRGHLDDDYDYRQSLRLDFADAAFEDLAARPELQPELKEMQAIVERWGY